jgi:flagellar basal-body rod modification protein FlgD
MSTISPIGTSTTATDSVQDAQSRIPAKTLTQDDFLKLLVTQYTMQDPLNPKQDTDFIAQMASFSSLEQSRSMQQDMAALRAEQQITQANSLLGRTVGIQVDQNTVATGVVTAVEVEAGTPRVVVNDQYYDLDRILTITPTLTGDQP